MSILALSNKHHKTSLAFGQMMHANRFNYSKNF